MNPVYAPSFFPWQKFPTARLLKLDKTMGYEPWKTFRNIVIVFGVLSICVKVFPFLGKYYTEKRLTFRRTRSIHDCQRLTYPHGLSAGTLTADQGWPCSRRESLYGNALPRLKPDSPPAAPRKVSCGTPAAHGYPQIAAAGSKHAGSPGDFRPAGYLRQIYRAIPQCR